MPQAHTGVNSHCFILQEKVINLNECIEGVDAEAVLLLLTYMYSSDCMSAITGMDLQQLEKAAVLADIWAVSRFLELCDAHLHGALSRPQQLTAISTVPLVWAR